MALQAVVFAPSVEATKLCFVVHASVKTNVHTLGTLFEGRGSMASRVSVLAAQTTVETSTGLY